MTDTVSLVALAMEVQSLKAIRLWHPVGALLDSITDAARSEGGMTRRDVERLRKWSRRWRELPDEIRSFYAAEMKSPVDSCVSSGLWRIFEGYQMDCMWVLDKRYEDRHGYRPWFELAPSPRRQR